MPHYLAATVAARQKSPAVATFNRDLSPAETAKRNNCSLSHMMRLLRLNYLAPDIVTAIMDGAQPKELTRRKLLDANLPLDWALQRKMFGFEEQPPMRTTETPY